MCLFLISQVWFRRGVNSHNPCGTSWIEMFGEMMMVNVGLNDQVCGGGGLRAGAPCSPLSLSTRPAREAARAGV